MLETDSTTIREPRTERVWTRVPSLLSTGRAPPESSRDRQLMRGGPGGHDEDRQPTLRLGTDAYILGITAYIIGIEASGVLEWVA